MLDYCNILSEIFWLWNYLFIGKELLFRIDFERLKYKESPSNLSMLPVTGFEPRVLTPRPSWINQAFFTVSFPCNSHISTALWAEMCVKFINVVSDGIQTADPSPFNRQISLSPLDLKKFQRHCLTDWNVQSGKHLVADKVKSLIISLENIQKVSYIQLFCEYEFFQGSSH